MATPTKGKAAGSGSAKDTTTEVVPPSSSLFPEVLKVDPEAVAERMKGRVRQADSLDALFDSLTGQTSDALIGQSFEFVEVAWQPYESDKGVIPMAVCYVVNLASGEVTEFVTTGGMLVEFLRRAEVLGAFPFRARIVGKKTNSGQTALNFERV